MIIFLFLSVPLWFLLLNTFFTNTDVRMRDFLPTVARGIIIYVCVLLFSVLLTRRLIPGQISFYRLFLYNYKYYNGLTVTIWLLVSTIASFLGKSTSGYELRENILFFCTLFFADSLFRVIISESWYGVYEYFFLPLANIGQIALLSILLMRMNSAYYPGKILYFFLSFLSLLLFNLVPTLFSFNLIFPAIAFGILIFASSIFLFFKELNGELPGGNF
jgi:hypothetical protein